jgi:hypothetical protein
VPEGKANADRPERKPADAAESGAASCPACGRSMKRWALICFPCFCKLPMHSRYALAAALPQRWGALNSAVIILRQMESDRRAFESGHLFEVGNGGTEKL